MRQPVALAISLAAACLALAPSWIALLHTWLTMADYQHGLLLAGCIVYWIVRRAREVPASQGAVSLRAALLLLLAELCWLIAYRAVSRIGQQLMIPPILWLAVWLGCGWPMARVLAAPLACLYFAIPVWEVLLPLLQHTTVAVTETTLGWLGIPVHIDGILVHIPEGTFQIAEGCAGKRYLIVALCIAGLLAGVNRLRPARATLLLAASALLALVTNWLRVMIVIVAGHLTDMQHYFVRREHISLGWVLFALLIAVICLLANRLGRQSSGGAASLRAPAPSEVLQPGQSGGVRAASAPLATTLGLLALLAAVQVYSRALPPVSAEQTRIELRATTGFWRGPGAADEGWSPEFRGATAQRRAAYLSDAGAVQIYIATYSGAREGAKLISFDNHLVPPHWIVLRRGTLRPAAGGTASPAVAALWVMDLSGRRWLVTYLYQWGPILTASPVRAQLAYGVLSWGARHASRMVAVAAPCGAGCADAEANAEDFWRSQSDWLTAVQ
ncbi:MAG: EpsI family protein [Proteobacteria bacterium]|nr:EpsI family protein [Pseudomonadota bacterium]